MTKQSHDHNFKNLFLDFPVEALELFFPKAQQLWGKVKKIEFLRQEPKKKSLSEAHFVLDMPILFSFDKQQLLLWLVEFQEDKSKFSIYKLLRYTTDFMEAYPCATVIPTVLFTDRRTWRKDVLRCLDTTFNDRLFLHFEYVFFKLFDFEAHDYYNVCNPLVKILLPKMNYSKDERKKVIFQAYTGLFQLVSSVLFDKYIDFIDVYAEVTLEEQQTLYHDMTQHKESIMLAQYIKDKGKQEGLLLGVQQGIEQGIEKGIGQGMIVTTKENIIEALELRFGSISSELIEKINKINDIKELKVLYKKAILIKEIDPIGFFS